MESKGILQTLPLKCIMQEQSIMICLDVFYIPEYNTNSFHNFLFWNHFFYFSPLNTTDCGTLTSPANGNITYSSGTTYLSSASFSCNPGYTKSSNVTRTCMADKKWSNATQYCIINGKFHYFKSKY